MKRITNLQTIHKKLNDILCYFADICDKYDLEYYLSNGTCLGAVKYQGFIPWDDDVDIFMPRESYDLFVNLNEVDTTQYKLFSMERNPKWKLPFAKLCDQGTVLKETTADFGCEIGLFIDIFPIDGWGNCRSLARLRALHSCILKRFLSASLENSFFSPRKDWRRPILYCIWIFAYVFGTEFWGRCITKLSLKHRKKKSCYGGCVVWAAYGRDEVLDASVYANKTYVMFEGRRHPIMLEYKKYLRQLYGKYDEEPPKHKQKTHHVFMIYEKEY